MNPLVVAKEFLSRLLLTLVSKLPSPLVLSVPLCVQTRMHRYQLETIRMLQHALWIDDQATSILFVI